MCLLISEIKPYIFDWIVVFVVQISRGCPRKPQLVYTISTRWWRMANSRFQLSMSM